MHLLLALVVVTTACVVVGGVIVSLVVVAGVGEIQQCGMCDQQRLRSACAYAQSDQSLCSSHEYSITVQLLTEDNLESRSLKGGCTGSSESTLVKMPNCWKSHSIAHSVLTLSASSCNNCLCCRRLRGCQSSRCSWGWRNTNIIHFQKLRYTSTWIA